jgi:hypothetical protein
MRRFSLYDLWSAVPRERGPAAGVPDLRGRARPSRPGSRRKPPLGLHLAFPRRDRGSGRGDRRDRSDLDLPPALLLLDGRVGGGLRRPHLPARCRPGVGHAPERSRRLLIGETRELGPGLTLVRCGGHYEGGTVLHWAAGRGGERSPAFRRHRAGDPGSRLRQFHVQLSEPDPLGESAIRGSWPRSSRLTSTESTAPGGIASSRRMRRPSSPARRSAT